MEENFSLLTNGSRDLVCTGCRYKEEGIFINKSKEGKKRFRDEIKIKIANTAAPDEKYRRFNHQFSQFETHHREFVVVPDMFDAAQCDTMKKIKLIGSDVLKNFEGINFDEEEMGKEGDEDKRFMTRKILLQLKKTKANGNLRITKSEPGVPQFLKDFVRHFMTTIHPTTIDAKVKLLFSYADGRTQHPHGDDKAMVEWDKPIPHADKSFTMLIALEPTENVTSILMGKRIADYPSQPKEDQPTFINKTINLAQGSILIMKGDCPHAGDTFKQDNFRLHIATNTPVFPHDPTVVGRLNNIIEKPSNCRKKGVSQF
jgi:hypothetical protein